MSESPWVVDSSEPTFDVDVVERSKQLPVVLDFWAPWCSPCVRLAPVLKKLAEEYAGRFMLVKANIDEMPEAAGRFQVESIPSVHALVDGELIDSFVGPKPESELRAWLEEVLPSPARLIFKEAEKLAASDPVAAEAKYREAIALSPQKARWREPLAALLADQGRVDEAHELLAELESRGMLSDQGEQIAAKVNLKRQTAGAGGVDACRAALAADPKSLAKKLTLSEALCGAGLYEEGFDLALTVVQADFGLLRERAKTLMVEAFQILGDADPRTVIYRRRLSASMY